MVPTTVNAPIGAPIRIPVAVVILTPPFGTHALNAKRHLAEAAALWRRAGIELDWSDTDPIDATGHPGAAAFQAPVTPCAGVRSAAGGPAGRLNIYYAGGLVGYNGFACGGFIMLSVTGARGALLAHEMGHEFGLPHEAGESGNLMAPRAGSIITEGQAFRAHFHSGSVVNAMFGIHRKEVVRNCDEPGPKSRGLQVVTRCPPTTFGIELR